MIHGKNFLIVYVGALSCLLACSPKPAALDGDSQYLPFAPDGIPFVVADSGKSSGCSGSNRC